jgi:hypothetical protein
VLTLPTLSYHATGSGTRPGISVDLDYDSGRAVVLTLDSETGETFDDRDVTRTLAPEEARALAAALVHYADQAER